MAGLRATVGYPSSRPQYPHGETIRRSATETEGAERQREQPFSAQRLHLAAPAARSPSRRGPFQTRTRGPLHPACPSPSRRSLPAALERCWTAPRGPHRTPLGPPCPLRGGREGRWDSSIGASLTQTPPPAATATAATGRSRRSLGDVRPQPAVYSLAPPSSNPLRLCVTSCLT